MDSIIRTNIDELIVNFKKSGINVDDPVSKLMITALVHQAQKIKDEISELPSKVLERLCSSFIPKNKIDAIPSLCFVQPSLKQRKEIGTHALIDGTLFNYKVDAKLNISFYPLYRNNIIPVSALHVLTPSFLNSKGTIVSVKHATKGHLWVGMELHEEIDSLTGFSFFIKGINNVLPKAILMENGTTELAFATADNFSEIPMMEPFDAQQVNPSFVEMITCWRNYLSNSESGRLIYITDKLNDRDVFKCKAFPKSFQQILESSDLDGFENNTLWFLLDFGEEYEIPSDIEIIPNVLPVVNVSVNSVTLTQSTPIAKLSKNDGSFFLNIIETSLPACKQGFNTLNEEIIIRDFDNACYNPGILQRDIRYLYNHFIDDYHAFVDYHGLKDGELIRSLRELVNRVGKSVALQHDIKNRYDEGTYAMRSVGLNGSSSAVKVSYLTTFGRIGNAPKAGSVMENKKDAAIDKDVKVIVSAIGGEDKATPDQKYEMLRYYTLTSDRLYTKMDIDAFLRLQLLKEFGKDEVKRISYDISIQGAGGEAKLVRGLYIDIRFKDEKNYRKAMGIALDRKLHQMIVDRSCISMPIIVNLLSLEQ